MICELSMNLRLYSIIISKIEVKRGEEFAFMGESD
jgi:hypothetical protein